MRGAGNIGTPQESRDPAGYVVHEAKEVLEVFDKHRLFLDQVLLLDEGQIELLSIFYPTKIYITRKYP